MKKHILGFAVFGFIFTSFAVVFAIINAPAIPQGDAVEVFGVPVYKEEKISSCRKSAKKLSYEIVSSHYDLAKLKLYTRVSLKWNGREAAPKNLFVNIEVSKPSETMVIYESTNVVSAFVINNRADVLIETDVNRNLLNGKLENIYAKYSFSENFVKAEIDENYSDVFPVVVLHKQKIGYAKSRTVILQ